MPISLRRERTRNTAAFYLFISPWLVGFLSLTFVPMLVSVYYSFCEYNAIQPPAWVGWDNFRTIFGEDPLFYRTVGNTLYFAAFAVPLGILAALILAILLNQKVKGLRFFRTAFYLPSIVPDVASAIIWLWLFNPQIGLIDAVLRLVGIDGPAWFSDPHWAKPALIIMSLWGVGGGMVIFLAGLQGIPRHLYEAAEIDGAGGWQQLKAITLPALTPTIFFNLIMGIISSFGYFTQAYVINNNSGGPLNATYFYLLYLFRKAFVFFEMGYASALAWVFFVVVTAFTAVQFWLSRHWVHYDES